MITDPRQGTTTQPDGGQDLGAITGAADADYDILWFTKSCLDNVVRLERYQADAKRKGDEELVEFFAKAQMESRKGADQAKKMLAARLTG